MNLPTGNSSFDFINGLREFLRIVAKQKRGNAVLVASTAGIFGEAGHADYAAAKSAIIGFTKSIAAYYAPHKIRCNALAPGLVRTPMAKRAAEDRAILDFIKIKQPLDGGRIGHPSDCDAAAIYFMSDSSRFTTGQILAIDGGWSVSEGGVA